MAELRVMKKPFFQLWNANCWNFSFIF